MLAMVLAGCQTSLFKNGGQQADSTQNSTDSAQQSSTNPPPSVFNTPKKPVGNYKASKVTGTYAGKKSVNRFIDTMVKKHDFDRRWLNGLFSTVQRQNKSIRLMDRYAPSKKKKNRPADYVGQPGRGSWSRYRRQFINDKNLQRGTEFWLSHKSTLRRVEREYQVPAHVIVGIIGVETRWGRITGDYVVLDTLSTIAFDYPRRSAYFTKELEEFLLMSREEGVDPRTPRGSYAGAMGLGQFMPSSFRKYAVDYSRDGVRDLMNPKDAIASVANYFKAHGWKPGEDVAVRANKSGSAYSKVKWGYSSNYTLRELSRVGVKPRKKIKTNEVSLLRFANYKSDEVWLGLNNFYVITRYNRSSKYAMAVYQLGEQLNKRVRPAKSASRESLLVLGES